MADVALSVLIPVHNGARTIRSAVRSTLRDLPPSAEVLVHDDASTDGTGDVLETVRDPRLIVHRSERSLGVAGALNALIGRARGRLLARMDADDLTLPGRFRSEIAALEGGLDLVFTSRVDFGAARRPVRREQFGAIGVDAFPLRLAIENPVAHPSALLRRDVVERAGGYRPGPAEDWELWLRLLGAGARGARITRPGIAYRIHASQVTRAPQWRAARASDPALHAAHSDLLQRLGWEDGNVLPALFESAPTGDGSDLRRRFQDFLQRRGAALPAREQRALSRRVRAVLT